MPIVLRPGCASSSGTSIVAHSRSPHCAQRNGGGAKIRGPDVVVTRSARRNDELVGALIRGGRTEVEAPRGWLDPAHPDARSRTDARVATRFDMLGIRRTNRHYPGPRLRIGSRRVKIGRAV
jgi:hypothetical protein